MLNIVVCLAHVENYYRFYLFFSEKESQKEEEEEEEKNTFESLSFARGYCMNDSRAFMKQIES